MSRRRLLLVLPLMVALVGCGDQDPEPRVPTSPRHDVAAATDVVEGQDSPWPARIVEGDESVAVYPPRVESREGDRVKARSAVEVERGEGNRSYGLVFIDARLRTENGKSTFEDVKYLSADFPAAREHDGAWVAFFQDRDPLAGRRIAERVIAHDLAPKMPLLVKNDPPRIVASEEPEVLVVIDGAPSLRPLGAVQRVINARALILVDGRTYWAFAGEHWFKGDALDAPFEPVETTAVPASILAARAEVPANGFDPMNDVTTKLGSGATLFVASKPTELLETRGAPTWTPIPGAALSYVENTDADIFRDDATKQGYVLLGGRWFTSASQAGPWSYVEPSKLPSGFQKIAPDGPKARVRAAIPGTSEAEEAVIASEIATVGAVDRSSAKLSVAFDGAPQFQAVEGTSAPLKYAINTETPVFLADDGAYYALENGVWFTSTSASGPWVVATRVPESIYSIPASSPVHYVTYARIYDWDPYWVWVGYTPGYYGAYVSGGVVVWGTGWYYRPWIGSVWYGRPYPWGWGVGFGFGVGYGIALGGFYHPWWGPARFAAYGGWGGPHGYVVARANAYVHYGAAVRAYAPPAHPGGLQRPQHAPPARPGQPQRSEHAPHENAGEPQRRPNVWRHPSGPSPHAPSRSIPRAPHAMRRR